VKNLKPFDPVAQVAKSVPSSLPASTPSNASHSPKPKSTKRAGKTKSASRNAKSQKQSLVQVQTAPAAASRQPISSPVAVAATTRNSELLGPIERYVGLDIGKITELCEVRQEQVTRRASIRKEQDLEQVLGPDTSRARVVLEACREAWYLHDLLTGWGHEVWVADTTRVRQLGIGQHKRKNDRIDAEILARGGENGKVPRAHVLSHASQRLRMQLGVRRALVETRAHYIVAIRSMLRSEGLQVPSCDVEAFLKKLSAMTIPAAVSGVIKPLVVALEAIGPQIENADEQLNERCDQLPIIRLLKSAPGVGPIVSAAFISVIDNPGRFKNAHQVESYLGLVPSESTSGKRKLGAITKQGNAYLRAMLVQAAWNVMRQRASDPVKSWGMALSKKRGKRVAAVAVARRLAGILWAMWRHNSCYDRSKVGQSSARGKRQEATRTQLDATTIEDAATSAT
jgi:transposase